MIRGRTPSQPISEEVSSAAHDSDEAVLRSGLASYKWGSGTIWFAALSAVQKRSPAETVIDLITQNIDWGSDAEFRRSVAYMHELVHYFQDLTTGIGHWDFVQRDRANQAVLPDLVRRFANHERSREGLNSSTLRRCLAASIMNGRPTHETKEEKEKLIRTAEEVGWLPSESVANLFTMQAILEAEAVLQVAVSVARTSVSESAQAVIDRNSSILNPMLMSDEYAALPKFMIQQAMHCIGVDTFSDYLAEMHAQGMGLAHQYHTSIFLIDLSCAYPPPTYFAGSGLQVEEFLPGVRLMRYMHAFEGDLYDPAEFSDDASLEQRLNSACGFDYPLMSEVYRMWKDYFEQDRGHAVARARASNANHRIDCADSFAKIGHGVAALNLPIVYAIDGAKGRFTLNINEHRRNEEFDLLHPQSLWSAVHFECVMAAARSTNR